MGRPEKKLFGLKLYQAKCCVISFWVGKWVVPSPPKVNIWSQFVTTCIRRLTGGYVFTDVCLSNFRRGGIPPPANEGYPPPSFLRGVLQGTTPVQDWLGFLLSRIGWGTPHLGLDGVPPCPPLGDRAATFTQKDFLVSRVVWCYLILGG